MRKILFVFLATISLQNVQAVQLDVTEEEKEIILSRRQNFLPSTEFESDMEDMYSEIFEHPLQIMFVSFMGFVVTYMYQSYMDS